jgi:hypothetical protein
MCHWDVFYFAFYVNEAMVCPVGVKGFHAVIGQDTYCGPTIRADVAF